MPELQIPAHPTHDFFCGNCKYWLAQAAQNLAYIQTQAGIQMVPVSELIKSGQPTKDLVTARVAPCTKFPKWETAPKQHWCHQYESAPKERVVKKDAGKFGAIEMPEDEKTAGGYSDQDDARTNPNPI